MQSQKEKTKNVVIAIMATYILMDILIPVMTGSKHMYAEFGKMMKKQGAVLAMVIAVGLGILLYCMLMK